MHSYFNFDLKRWGFEVRFVANFRWGYIESDISLGPVSFGLSYEWSE